MKAEIGRVECLRLVRQSGGGVLTSHARHRDGLCHETREGCGRKVGRIGRGRALADEDPQAERLAARIRQLLDLTLADRHREVGARHDQRIGVRRPLQPRPAQELFRQLESLHGRDSGITR